MTKHAVETNKGPGEKICMVLDDFNRLVEDLQHRKSTNVKDDSDRMHREDLETAQALRSMFNTNDPDSQYEAARDSQVDLDNHTKRKMATMDGTCMVQVLENNIHVSPPKEFHETWDDCHKYLHEYEAQTHQVIRIREVLKCEARNARLKMSKKAMRGLDVDYVPEEWVIFQRRYICTHGWKPKDRGKGDRPRKYNRFTNCPFRFLVQLVNLGGIWCLQVKSGLFQHNHDLGHDTFGTYSSQLPCTNVNKAAAPGPCTNVNDAAAPGGASPFIVERWMKAEREACTVSTSSNPAAGCKRSRTQRYEAASTAMRKVVNELAEIEDDNEFDKCLLSIAEQWKRIRPRKSQTFSECKRQCRSPDADPYDEQQYQVLHDHNQRTPEASMEQCHADAKQASYGKKEMCNDGEMTLEKLLNKILRDKPRLRDLSSLVDSVPVKFTERAKSQPSVLKLDHPVVHTSGLYVLPIKLLRACLALQPSASTVDDAISISSQPNHLLSPRLVDEVVVVPGVGQYSQAQIKTMIAIQEYKAKCKASSKLVQWLSTTVLRAVPDVQQGRVQRIITRLENEFVDTKVQAFEDIAYSTLYRMKPPEWFNDAIIRGFCECLTMSYPQVRYGGMPSLTTKSKGTDGRTTHNVVDDVVTLAQQEGVDFVFLPVNFNNSHWCGLIVHVKLNAVMYYDSLAQESYTTRLDAFARTIVQRGLDQFRVIAVNTPIQFDGHSCGFYVCLRFWSYLKSDVYCDMTPGGMLTRRFEIMEMIVGYHTTI